MSLARLTCDVFRDNRNHTVLAARIWCTWLLIRRRKAADTSLLSRCVDGEPGEASAHAVTSQCAQTLKPHRQRVKVAID